MSGESECKRRRIVAAAAAPPPVTVSARTVATERAAAFGYCLPTPLSKTYNRMVAAVSPSPNAVGLFRCTKGPYTFVSPMIESNPLHGVSFVGFQRGDFEDAATMGHVRLKHARPALEWYDGGKPGSRSLVSSRPQKGGCVGEEDPHKRPIAPLGPGWSGVLSVPPMAVFSLSYRALFGYKDFEESGDEAAAGVDVGAGNPVHVVVEGDRGSMDRSLQVQSADTRNQPCRAPQFDRFVVACNLLPKFSSNHSLKDGQTVGKEWAIVSSVMENGNRPLSVEFTNRKGAIRKAQAWPSVLKEAGISITDLQQRPLIAFIESELNKVTNTVELRLRHVVVAAPAKQVTVCGTDVLREYINRVNGPAGPGARLTPEERGRIAKSATAAVLHERRPVPVSVMDIGHRNSIIFDAPRLVELVRNGARKLLESATGMSKEDAEELKRATDTVKTATDDTICQVVSRMEDPADSDVTLEAIVNDNSLMMECSDDVQYYVSYVFMHALVNHDPASPGSILDRLCTMVGPIPQCAEEEEESDFEDDAAVQVTAAPTTTAPSNAASSSGSATAAPADGDDADEYSPPDDEEEYRE